MKVYDGRITEASIISTRRQLQLRHKNFSLQLQLNFTVSAESFVHHMQSNGRFILSFSCQMWLQIKALVLLPNELLIKISSRDWRYILEFPNFAV